MNHPLLIITMFIAIFSLVIFTIVRWWFKSYKEDDEKYIDDEDFVFDNFYDLLGFRDDLR